MIPVSRAKKNGWLSNFQDNPLEFFAQYNIHLHEPHVAALEKRSAQLPAVIADLQKQIAALPAGDAKISHLKIQMHEMQEYLDGVNKDREIYKPDMFDALSDREKSLHKKAFDTIKTIPTFMNLLTLNMMMKA